MKEIVEARGASSSTCHPTRRTFNPIEQTLDRVHGLPRRAEAHTREALIEAMGRALDAITVHDVLGFFAHCGYRPGDQLP